MRKIKKYIATILGVLFALSSVAASAIMVMAADNVMSVETNLVSDKNTYLPGEEVKLTFSIGDIVWADNRIDGTGLIGFQVPITWNPDILEFVTVKPGPGIKDEEIFKYTGKNGSEDDLNTLKQGKLMVHMADGAINTEEYDIQFYDHTELFTAVFKVRESVTNADTSFTYDQVVDGYRMFFMMNNEVYINPGNPNVTVNWTNTSGNPEIQVRDSITITERYWEVTEDGSKKELLQDNSVTVPYGGSYSKIAEETLIVDNVEYYFDYAEVNGQKVLDQNGMPVSNVSINNITEYMDYTVEYYYLPPDPSVDQYTITEEYVDEEGNAIMAPTSSSVNAGGSYTKARPEPSKDYVFIGAKVDGIPVDLVDGESVLIDAVNADHTVTFLYKYTGPPVTMYTVTEKYQNRSGQAILDTTTTLVAAGEGYSKQAPAIDNYVLTAIFIDGVQVTGGDIAEIASVTHDQEVIFIYTSKDELNGGSGASGADTNNLSNKNLGGLSTNPVTGVAGAATLFTILALSAVGMFLIRMKKSK